jgi:hypothetical protein
MRTAISEHFAAASCRHARAEAMPPFAHQLARLIGPFHGFFSGAPTDRGNTKEFARSARLIRKPFRRVNAITPLCRAAKA